MNANYFEAFSSALVPVVTTVKHSGLVAVEVREDVDSLHSTAHAPHTNTNNCFWCTAKNGNSNI